MQIQDDYQGKNWLKKSTRTIMKVLRHKEYLSVMIPVITVGLEW